MSKQPVISTEAQVLLKLLRLALATEPRRYFGEPVEPFPTNINWKEIIRLSYDHKVSALAVDGFKSSGYDIYKGLNNHHTNESYPFIQQWVNDILNIENSYTYYVEVLRTLCHIFTSNGLIPIILKGYGLSLNYPNPSHRGVGDIDIYIVDKEGNAASDIGVRLIQDTLGLKITRTEESKHSVFEFKGIEVEIHHELRDSFYYDKQGELLLRNLKELIQTDYVRTICNENIFYLPQATFNLVFLISHLYADFYYRRANLRQFTDYILFIHNHFNEVNWSLADKILTDAGLQDFYYAVNQICSTHLNMSATSTTKSHQPIDSTADNLLNILFHPSETNKLGIHNLDIYYRNRWYYKYFQREHWFPLTVKRIISYIGRKIRIIH